MAITGFKNLRSPFYVMVVPEGGGTANLDVWVYNGESERSDSTLNAYGADYSLTSTQSLFYPPLGEYVYIFEISGLVSDYLDTKFTGDFYNDTHVIVSYRSSETVSDSSIITYATEHYYCVNGYDYFNDDSGYSFNSVINTKTLLQSNNIVYTYDDHSATFHINTFNTSRVDFYANNESVGSLDVGDWDAVIPPVSTNGSNVSSASFRDRVLSSNGTIVNNLCFDDFLDSVNIYPADKIVITDTNGNLETITIIPIEECKYEPHKVIFLNRFGVYQELWFFKKSKLKSEFEREYYNNESIFARGGRDNHTKITLNTKSKDSLVLNSGFVDEQYNEVFRELMLSESVFIDYEDKIMPINIKGDSLDYKTRVNDRLIDYTIEAEFSFSKINNLR